MAHITDPRMLLALQIHKGAIRLMQSGHSYERAMEYSKDLMQELFPQETVTTFRVPHWSSHNS